MRIGISGLILICSFSPTRALAQSDKAPEADGVSALADLSKGVELTAFKAWEGTYEGMSGDGIGTSRVSVTDCNAHGCAFDSEAGFATAASEDTPASGGCEYRGRFRFLSETRAVAWASTDLIEFTGDIAKLKESKKPDRRDGKVALSQAQKIFLKRRDDCKADTACIKARYEERLRVLAKP